MAAITGNFAVAVPALTASTAQEVILAEANGTITVTTRTASEVWFTVGASNAAPTTATVGGVDNFLVPAVVGASKTVRAGVAPTTVSVISTGTPTLAVDGGQSLLVRPE